MAHVSHDELGDAGEGEEIWVDLRSPKAFGIEPDPSLAFDLDVPVRLEARSPDIVAT